ncbi:MAG: bifunctional diguanylate cyclase/phosphodiesterase [Lachnospiraceae bacterium]|nr:bifunctional diguanylate cyclase/phosphodiesterase [Lachnospiraceae bacterium]
MKENGKSIDKTLRSLSARRQPPKVFFAVLLGLFIAASFFLPSISSAQGVVFIFDRPIPIAAFTGVLSSLANICIIMLPVYYGKVGFYTSLAILIGQIPIIITNMVNSKNYTAVQGIFSTLLAIVAIIIIFVRNNQLDKYQERMRIQAVTDPVTGLPNRFACMELMDDLVKRGIEFALVSIDLNNFKSINDTMGHDVGNEVLVEISNRWRNLADSWTTGTADFVVRLAGDEYALVIRGYRSIEEIIRSINLYRDELEKKITIDNCDYYVTASFGFAQYPVDADNSTTLFSCADAAMHKVKAAGNTTYIMHYSPSISNSEQALEIERKIRAGLDNNTFYINLQPQFDMGHKLRGFEALARMKDAEGNFISPGEFIPVAEKTGLIEKIDLCVFQQAASFLAEAMKQTSDKVILSINVSVRHLMKNNFIDEIKSVIEESGIPATRLEIEITESIMIDSADKALKRINELKNLGVKIAIDDFGTGYSSLSYLNKIPADILKIDKAFIDEINKGSSSKQYVASIISIGNVFDLEVISEGVETEDQLDTLRSIGCDYIQGYIWGKPMMPEDALQLVGA